MRGGGDDGRGSGAADAALDPSADGSPDADADADPNPDACASYRNLYERLDALEADTHLHVHEENNVLFPKALALEAELLAHQG